MSKKLTLLVACLLLCTGLATGCGGNSKEIDDTTKTIINSNNTELKDDSKDSQDNKESTTETTSETTTETTTEAVVHTPVPAVFESEEYNDMSRLFKLTYDSSLVRPANIPPAGGFSMDGDTVVCWVDDNSNDPENGCSFTFVRRSAQASCETMLNILWSTYTLHENKPITVNNLSGHMAVYEIDSFMGCVIALDLGDGYTLQITGDYNYMTLNGHTPEELIGATYISYELIRY